MLRFTLLMVAVLSMFVAVRARAQTPLDSAFTYQGELASAGMPATGTYDVRFRLYDAATGGNQIGSTLCSDNLAITNGRFMVSLDFGAAFAGQKRFLEIEVRQETGLDCSNASGYTLLTPRQELTATPHATFARSAATASTATTATNAASLNGQPPSFYQNAANLTGTLADAQLSSNIARLNGNQTFTGLLNLTNVGNTFAGSGSGLTNLNGASINAGTLARSSLSTDVQRGVGTAAGDLSLKGSVATGIQPSSVAVSGSFAYVVNIVSSTLQVFNISNPAAPTLAGSIGTGDYPVSVAVSGSSAYVVNAGSDSLQVFNISNPAAPTLAGSVATGSQPYSVAVSGSLAYVVNRVTRTLQVFNISNPAAPTVAGSVATGIVPSCVAVSGLFAYVVNSDSNTLQVFNVSNPAAPTLAGSIGTGNYPFFVAVSGSFAYVVNYSSNTLQVFNISNPGVPTLAGSVATGSSPSSIAVSGSSAYVVNQGSSTLQIFNISSPTAPALAGSIATGTGPSSVAVTSPFAYVVNFSSGTLQVFNADTGISFGAPLAASSLAGVNGASLTGVNASQLNGQTASFYTNASNIASGTLSDLRLSSNIPLKNVANSFTSTGTTTFAGRLVAGSSNALTNPSASIVAVTSTVPYGLAHTDGTISVSTYLGGGTGGGWIGTVTNHPFSLFVNDGAPSLTVNTNGSVSVTGSLSKGGGSFKIDHPLDPENKYLYHSFVESPDMMNIYNGNVTTDADGYATITLPDYFEALNRDFRYQLTVIDESDNMEVFLWAKVVREVKDNQFTLRSSRGNLKVSWQVTGIRHDAWAEKNRIPNSVEKTGAEKGKYLHPAAFDKPVTQGVYFVPANDLRQENK